MNRDGLRPIAAIDIIIVVGLILSGCALFPLLQSGMPETVSIFRDNALIAKYPLKEDRQFTVDGTVGPVTIAVHNVGAHVLASTCPRGICLHASPIKRPGQQIVCAPNHLSIVITAKKDGNIIDALAE